MASSSSSPSSSSPPSNSKETNSLRKEMPHVLAVDDSLVDRKFVETLLIRSACKVTTAENGKKALEFLGLADGQDPCNSNLEVNLIITDYNMPGMTGFELLKKIKESPTMKNIPVIIVSSENNPRQIEQCMKEGANGFYIKPLNISYINKLRIQIKEHCKTMLVKG